MSKFKVGDTWFNRDGTELLILSTTAPGDQPIVGVAVLSGKTEVRSYLPSGQYYRNHACDLDLVTKVEPVWEGEISVSEDGEVCCSDVSQFHGWRRIRVREVR